MFSCICVDDFEPHTVTRIADRIARKHHTCVECGAVIEPGDVYAYAVTLFEGEWSTYKTCGTCATIRSDVFPCGWIYGQMWEDIHAAHCDDEYCLCPTKHGG